MSNPQPQSVSPRTGYLIRGALLGLALGFGMVIASRGDTVPSAPWFLIAATVVGSVTGLDLYLTRKWRRFGRLTPIIRFAVACSGAAGLTSALGVLLRLIPLQLAWSFTAFGAIAGLLYGIWEFGTSD